MLQPQNITDFFIQTLIRTGDTVIDATAGNGNDTLKLCKAVGSEGRVLSFDIQKCALDATAKKLADSGFSNAELICDSHADMDKYVTTPVSAVIFNLGYLPGGDHSVCTRAESTIKAIEHSLNLICDTGFVSVTVYYGKNSGTEEKDSVMNFLKNLDYKQFTVITHDFYNRPNNPPLTVIITKN